MFSFSLGRLNDTNSTERFARQLVVRGILLLSDSAHKCMIALRIDLFLRVRLVSTNSYVESYLVCEGGFCAKLSWFWPWGHGVAPRRPYLRLWSTYALDPAHRRDPDTMGDAAMCWVGGIRPPQQEKIDADRTLFLG